MFIYSCVFSHGHSSNRKLQACGEDKKQQMIDFVPSMALVWILWVCVCFCVCVHVCTGTCAYWWCMCVWLAKDHLKCHSSGATDLETRSPSASKLVWLALGPPRSPGSTSSGLGLQGSAARPIFFTQGLNSDPHVHVASTNRLSYLPSTELWVLIFLR